MITCQITPSAIVQPAKEFDVTPDNNVGFGKHKQICEAETKR